MKKSISTLIALGFAGCLFPATAQTAPDNSPPTQEQAATPATPATPGSPVTEAATAPEAATPAPPSDAGAEPAPMPPDQAAPEGTNAGPAVILPTQALGLDKSVKSDFMPPTDQGTNSNDLNLNFNRAPIDMVLNYLSDAAGFIIVLDTRVTGTVSVTGKHLNKDEAVDLLNSVLNKNGYAAIRDGRTLTIVDKNDAKTRDIPVKVSNNPNEIPKNDEIVTQIIPIRFVEARQLVSDLSSFVSPQATVVANEAGNSIVITDTQSNIRHLAEIIKAIDDSAEAETEIRVFHLKYASPTDVAAELGNVFPASGAAGGATQSPIRFGGAGGGNPFARFFGGGGGGGLGGGGGGAAGGGTSNDRIKKATQVTAVADARIQAVIVTAPKDLMEEIAGVMKDLDVSSDRDQDVYVFQTKNGDPQQMLTVLQSMFQGSSSRSTTGSSANSALQQRQQTTATTTSSSSSTTGFGTSGSGGRGGTGGGF